MKSIFRLHTGPKKPFRVIIMGLSLASLSITPALADNVDNAVTFNGVIPESCTVTVLTSGTLAVSSEQDELSSDLIGGLPATASIVTNSSSSVVRMINPTGFASAPSGAADNMSYSTSYLLAGTTIGLEADGETQTTLNLGLSTITIDATATKSSGTLPTGSYTLSPTLRCITL